MIINLNQSNQVDYKGLRQGNAFGFSFELLLNEVPIVADDYTVLLEIYRNFQKVHSVVDWEWTRVDDKITKLYDSFPLDAADYKFHCTLTNTDDQQTTYVNGTIQVIDKYAVYTGTENNEEIQANVNAGIPGPAGEGVPAGGDTGQVLAKASGDDYDTEWVDQSGGGGGGAVSSVFGRTGAVTAESGDYTKAQVGLENVDNTSDADKPVSTAQQTALDLKENFAVGTTGSEISFVTKQVYNSPGSPSTSNITDNLTSAKIGVVQKIYHNNSTPPTFPAGWVRIGTGNYVISTLNIIYAEWVSGTRVEYWVSQPA